MRTGRKCVPIHVKNKIRPNATNTEKQDKNKGTDTQIRQRGLLCIPSQLCYSGIRDSGLAPVIPLHTMLKQQQHTTMPIPADSSATRTVLSPALISGNGKGQAVW